LQDTLAALASDAAAGRPSWTVFDNDREPSAGRRVVFRPLAGQASTTSLAFRRRSPALDDLLAALRQSSHLPLGDGGTAR
jgi:hypothetical protein